MIATCENILRINYCYMSFNNICTSVNHITYCIASGLFSKVKISRMVYKVLNKITICL